MTAVDANANASLNREQKVDKNIDDKSKKRAYRTAQTTQNRLAISYAHDIRTVMAKTSRKK